MASATQEAVEIVAHWVCDVFSFNPKPEAMAGAMCGRSILLPAVAYGFGLNDVAFGRKRCGRYEEHRLLLDEPLHCFGD